MGFTVASQPCLVAIGQSYERFYRKMVTGELREVPLHVQMVIKLEAIEPTTVSCCIPV